MNILFINNDGSGFADETQVTDGTTITQLFHERIKNADPTAYLIRVNRQPVNSGYVLQEGDRVSITPTKIEGATKILFINNDGSGFADETNVAEGITIIQLFHERIKGVEGNESDPSGYLIRVNRQPVNSSYVIQDGDRVSVTPTKIEGAGAIARQ